MAGSADDVDRRLQDAAAADAQRLHSAHDRVRDFLPRLREVIQGLERRAVTARAATLAAADERARWLCTVRLD